MTTQRFMIVALLLTILTATHARTAAAADLSLSPFRAQLTEAGGSAQAPADETSTFDPTKKSVGKGVMFSLIIPGTGQLYAGSWLRALPWLAIEAAGWAMFASYHGQGQDKTDEFEKFAGTRDNPNNFSYAAYMLREYQVALRSVTPYSGQYTDWISETWAERQEYLEPPYGHDLNTDDIQQYFEMIGKYYTQFGYGWRDTHDPNTIDLTSQDLEYAPWSDPANGYTDDHATIGFDGNSPMFFAYRDMRGEANDYLDKGNTMMEIVLVNHVLSALDAAFAIRNANRKAEEPLGGLKLEYDVRTINGSSARLLTASLPLKLTR